MCKWKGEGREEREGEKSDLEEREVREKVDRGRSVGSRERRSVIERRKRSKGRGSDSHLFFLVFFLTLRIACLGPPGLSAVCDGVSLAELAESVRPLLGRKVSSIEVWSMLLAGVPVFLAFFESVAFLLLSESMWSSPS